MNSNLNRVKRKVIGRLLLSLLAGAMSVWLPVTVRAEDPLEPTAVVIDFEAESIDELPFTIEANGANCQLVSDEDHNNRALRVVFPNQPLNKNVRLNSSKPWNWQSHNNSVLMIDIENLSPDSAQLFMVLQGLTCHANIPAHAKRTCYFSLSSPQLGDQLGITGSPPLGPDATNAMMTPFAYAWGNREINMKSVQSIQFYMKGNLTQRVLRLDNFRFAEAKQSIKAKGIIDEFGQFADAAWSGKTASVNDLDQQAQSEAAKLKKSVSFSDHSKFGGWAAGPKLEATGFFRTEKHQGKWVLVDPEGHLFFATGIANCRPTSATMTGNDYENFSNKQGRSVASKSRRDLFQWIPEPSDPLGKYLGYVGQLHAGPLSKGETFSFYRANLERKYGPADPLKAWTDTTLKRMKSWGFTTIGNWADPMLYGNQQVAYFAHVNIEQGHATVASGRDYWGPFHDPFDPEFVKHANEAAQTVVDQVKGDPWCVGVFVDNELSWGTRYNRRSRFGLVLNALKLDAAASPAKAAFVKQLRDKYSVISDLADAWGGLA